MNVVCCLWCNLERCHSGVTAAVAARHSQEGAANVKRGGTGGSTKLLHRRLPFWAVHLGWEHSQENLSVIGGLTREFTQQYEALIPWQCVLIYNLEALSSRRRFSKLLADQL